MKKIQIFFRLPLKVRFARYCWGSESDTCREHSSFRGMPKQKGRLPVTRASLASRDERGDTLVCVCVCDRRSLPLG